ncbi:hypothetical protein IP92_05525 [Pseudoduganella flava]|uniref:DUF1109 family protein n=1 Tax=Pseudoduganella flava TaxID=871742 RepID=A0A562PCS8_9BURK|nr:DUF1109 domain-containing protein [Pseudoduganella flava]QGZ40114.1 DUF1109 family protein [Pseudoduganella flava]TWI42133.1 hypothetical protein IP92_05525 [Pseudoduganella flava]
MNTDDLIATLAKDTAIRRPAPLALALPLAAGVGLSVLFVVAVLGVRPNLGELAANGLFWLKCAFVGALALIGFNGARIASIPAARFHTLPWLLTLPALLMAGGVIATLADADTAGRAAQFWGRTWRTCPFLIALLSLPIFVATLYRMRRFAPTHLRLAGAIAGFTSGALAALLYCLHCPELAPTFVAVWYTLGILIPTAIGALAGPRLLAW